METLFHFSSWYNARMEALDRYIKGDCLPLCIMPVDFFCKLIEGPTSSSDTDESDSSSLMVIFCGVQLLQLLSVASKPSLLTFASSVWCEENFMWFVLIVGCIEIHIHRGIVVRQFIQKNKKLLYRSVSIAFHSVRLRFWYRCRWSPSWRYPLQLIRRISAPSTPMKGARNAQWHWCKESAKAKIQLSRTHSIRTNVYFTKCMQKKNNWLDWAITFWAQLKYN